MIRRTPRLLALALSAAAGCSGTTSSDGPTSSDHYVFVTSGAFAGDLKTAGGAATGLDSADAICGQAAAGALPGTWKAWISDSTTNAIDRITEAGPWLTVGDRSLAFHNKANLATSPVVAVDIDEQGKHIVPANGDPAPVAWTGTSIGGDKTAATCSDWTSVAQGATGVAGDADVADNQIWTDYRLAPCNAASGHLYCLQQ